MFSTHQIGEASSLNAVNKLSYSQSSKSLGIKSAGTENIHNLPLVHSSTVLLRPRQIHPAFVKSEPDVHELPFVTCVLNNLLELSIFKTQDSGTQNAIKSQPRRTLRPLIFTDSAHREHWQAPTLKLQTKCNYRAQTAMLPSFPLCVLS